MGFVEKDQVMVSDITLVREDTLRALKISAIRPFVRPIDPSMR